MAGRNRANARDIVAGHLAAGRTFVEAAQAAGVNDRTVRRWWEETAFRHRVCELRTAAVERSLGRLSDAMTAAADELRELLSAESENVRLGAARSLIELGVKLRDSVELTERVAALEGMMAQTNAALERFEAQS
jgi:HEAT repeat protein